jgi:hypothetical protein
MAAGELKRVAAATAAEVAEGRGRAPALSDEARALLEPGLTPGAYLDRLTGAGHLADAELFLAHALPKREAVWWGCRCARRAAGPEPPAEAAAALAAAEAWAAAPGDVNRRKTYPAAEAAGFGHPAGCVALAVFLSGGSIAPPGLAPVPPAEHLTGDCVASALKIAAVLNDPATAPEAHRAFLEIGLAVARGEVRWKENL